MHRTARDVPLAGPAAAWLGCLLLLAGCTVSGSTTDASTEAPTPTTSRIDVEPSAPSTTSTPTIDLVEPVVGTCRSKLDRDYLMTAQSTVGCDELHLFETAYVGEFGPEATGPDRIEDALYAEAQPVCLQQVGSYLGSVEWGSTSLWPYVYLPAVAEWQAGARWFRCEVGRYTGLEGATFVIGQTGSLRNALADGGLGIYRRCAVATGEEFRVVDCGEPHHREAMDPVLDLGEVFLEHPGDDGLEIVSKEVCPGVLEDYVGSRRDDLSWWANWPSEDEWNSFGHRNLVCSAVSAESVTGSVEGVGSGPLTLASDPP